MYNSEIEDFSSEFDKTKKLLSGLNSEIQQKKALLSQSKPTNNIDASLREKIRKIEANLRKFLGILKDWESSPELYNMTLREVERRRNQISELNNSLQEMKAKAFEEGGEASLTKEREKLFKDGNYANPAANNKKFTVEETLANQKVALKSKVYDNLSFFYRFFLEQDDQIDNLIGNVQNIKVIGQNIGTEINEQNVLLDDLDRNIDRNVVQMEKTSSKFVQILENSSTWKLFVVIGIEIVILIIIIIFA